MRIDAHQHFWIFDPVRDNWITDEMQVIRRNFLPADAKPLLDRLGFDGCIAVQADQSEKETAFLLKLAEENNFIKAVVGWIDLCSENIELKLESLKQEKLLKGFRHILQAEEDRAFMLRPGFKRGISALGRFGLSYDILVLPDQLAFVEELVRAYPEQRFVIDHLAKPPIREGMPDHWEGKMRRLAQYENVYCKLSGMVTEARWNHWHYHDFLPYLDVIVQSFGTRRIMYGSDWPVCLLAAGYNDTYHIVEQYFSAFSIDDQNRVFGGNAADFYQIN